MEMLLLRPIKLVASNSKTGKKTASQTDENGKVLSGRKEKLVSGISTSPGFFTSSSSRKPLAGLFYRFAIFNAPLLAG